LLAGGTIMQTLDEGPAGSKASGSISLGDEEGVRDLIKDTIFGLWATVNNLTRLRPSSHERFRVTVFGSARTEPGHWVYDEVRRMCAGLSALGCDIVTGGGPGLMEAANRGASEGDPAAAASSVGIRVHLPFEQNVNPFVEQAFEHGTFFTRLHQFVLMSDAYIVAPGGVGTLLETAMIWQLLQVRQLDVPLVVAGPMWKDLVEWARVHMLRPDFELASPKDMEIPICVANADEAVEALRPFYEKWRMTQGADVALA
jgi:uncharacterized protein (TIGR00730 family)